LVHDLLGAHRVHHADQGHDEDLVGDRDQRGRELLDGEGLGRMIVLLALRLGLPRRACGR
jgi:hypothetical protein